VWSKNSTLVWGAAHCDEMIFEGNIGEFTLYEPSRILGLLDTVNRHGVRNRLDKSRAASCNQDAKAEPHN
jgi:hypothetical protein